MATYQIQVGDTLELIARRVYGTEHDASVIRTANPDISDALSVGANIFIPDSTIFSDPVSGGLANTPDEVALSIDSQRFRFWQSVTITRSIDTTSTVEFTAPFEPSVPAHRKTFRPMSFKAVGVTVGGEPLFKGIMLNSQPEETPESTVVTVTCYSKTGVLNDCTLPASMFPLEFNNQTLDQIASTICRPFGISVSAKAFGAAFERVAAKSQEKVLQFIVSLTGQRNTVVSDTPLGELLIQQSIEPGKPVARLSTGQSPVVKVTPLFKPQQYFSHITGIQPVAPGLDGAKYTVKNKHASGFLRPANFLANDAQDGDLKTTVEAKSGRMMGDAISYLVEMNTWRDPSGRLWADNTTIELLAPGAMIYSYYEFLIRTVVFRGSADTRTATLTIVLPGAFSGKIPEVLPWE